MDKLERVARALCEVDGLDPDEKVPIGGVETMRQGNAVVTGPKMGPQWMKHEKEARRFAVAFEALGGTITSGG